jgi:hypothetical protein
MYQQRRAGREREDLAGGVQIGYQAPVFARRIRAIATVGIRALPARRFMPPPPGCRSWVPGSSSCTHTQNQRNCYLWNQSPTSRAPLSCSRIICPCVSLPHAHRARSPPSLRDAGSPPPDPKAPSHHATVSSVESQIEQAAPSA